jgi:hypothetical protein
MDASNRKSYKFLVKRVRKTPHIPTDSEGNEQQIPLEDMPSIMMWGLYAMEEIPIGAFILEYVGEMVTKKQGDMRGTFYDAQGLSYLFDMNDALPDEHREQTIQTAY